MKLLIDANILLDVLQKREPHFGASALIWKLCETGQAQGCVSGLSIANLVYVMRRELTAGQVRDVLEKLALIFDVVDLTAADIERAAQAMWSDFEDALQSAAAARAKAGDARAPILGMLHFPPVSDVTRFSAFQQLFEDMVLATHQAVRHFLAG